MVSGTRTLLEYYSTSVRLGQESEWGLTYFLSKYPCFSRFESLRYCVCPGKVFTEQGTLVFSPADLG